MMIRRIAASAAVALTLAAAVPGVAMASTAGSAPRPVPVRCPPRIVKKVGGTVTITVTQAGCCATLIRVGSPSGQQVRPAPAPVVAVACKGKKMTFDLPAFGSTATELSGPRLTAHEILVYRQRVFMVRSVHGHEFTLFKLPALTRQHRGVQVILAPFRNGATAITKGHAVVLRGPVAITVSGGYPVTP